MAKKKKSSKKKTVTKKKSTKKKTRKKAKKKKTTKSASRRRSSRSSAKPPEEVCVAVSFRRRRDSASLLSMSGPIGKSQMEGFELDSLDIDKAIQVFGKHGFKISSRGKYSITVRGNRKKYEKLFGTKLSATNLSHPKGTRLSHNAVFFPADGAPWNPSTEISGLIDDAYIQWPHIYLNNRFGTGPSPLPPQVNYHHLRVPGDVSMVMNADRVHRLGITGHGVRVAMIDSGFNHSLPYFQERGYNSSVVLAPGATDVDLDGNGHGTGESANLFAVAPDITFIGVKLDDESGGLGASMHEGFIEALSHNPDVITVSLAFDLVFNDANRTHLPSLPSSLTALQVEIQAAIDDGIVVVFSAGNGHVAFPGMMPDVISVGGVFVDRDGEMQASDYASAFDSRIYAGRSVPDFCGLVGQAINSANYIMLPLQEGCDIDVDNSIDAADGTATDDGWGVFSGTSASAPQVAGVCALLLQADPDLTPLEIKQILRRTSSDVVNGHANAASNEGVAVAASSGGDGATGAGLVDAFAAVQQI